MSQHFYYMCDQFSVSHGTQQLSECHTYLYQAEQPLNKIPKSLSATLKIWTRSLESNHIHFEYDIYIYTYIYIFVNFLLKSHSEQWMGGPWLLTNKRHWSHNLLHFVGRGRAQLSRGTLARVAGFSSPLAWMTPGRSPRAALQQTTEPDLDVGPPSPATAAHGASETPNGSTWRKASANSGWLNGLIENPIWRLSKKGLSHVDARWTFPFQLQGTQI